MRQVTRVTPETLLLSASFSPDGARIDYAQTGDGGLPDIFTRSRHGTDTRQVTRNL